MNRLSRALAASAAGVLISSIASAQYSTDFEGVLADAAGTVLTGQDGYYIPAGTTSADFLAFTYAGNAFGVAPNPTGGNQFVSCNGPAAGAFGRAQRDITWGAGVQRIGFDVHGSFQGTLPSAQNLGSFSMQPFPGGQSFIALAAWTDPATATAWNMNLIYHDAAGTQIQEVVANPAFQNLPVGAWYRWEIDVDLTTNRILCTSVTDLSTGAKATQTLVERYMFGGAAGSPAPTGFRLFSGGGVAGNTLSFDNVSIGDAPVGSAPDLIHYTFNDGTAKNSATGSVGDGTAMAGVGWNGTSPLCPGAGAPYAESIATGATCEINTNWVPNLGAGDWTIGAFLNIQSSGTTIQYIFGASTASSFRCFTNGVAGANNWLLRGAGLPDVPIAGGAVPGTTSHIVWCRDSVAGEVRAYLDGVLVNTVPTPNPSNLTGTGTLTVMRYNGSTSALAPGGRMDDFRLYSRCLTAAEVAGWAACANSAFATSYCDPAVANSTGNPGQLAASGTSVVALNALTFTATNLPLNSFGVLLTSIDQDNVPMAGGGAGTLCLGGAIGRGVGGAIFSSGATGEVSVLADLTNHPTPAGFTVVMPCQTWNFQYWYRDAGMPATSNLTNAVSVTFY